MPGAARVYKKCVCASNAVSVSMAVAYIVGRRAWWCVLVASEQQSDLGNACSFALLATLSNRSRTVNATPAAACKSGKRADRLRCKRLHSRLWPKFDARQWCTAGNCINQRCTQHASCQGRTLSVCIHRTEASVEQSTFMVQSLQLPNYKCPKISCMDGLLYFVKVRKWHKVQSVSCAAPNHVSIYAT